MEYVLAGISPILVIPFHLYSIWNGQIPGGFHQSIWNIPDGIYMEYSTIFPVDSSWIPFNSTWNDGIKVDSSWIPPNSTWNDGIRVDSSWIPH
jgi:hypothetical protein